MSKPHDLQMRRFGRLQVIGDRSSIKGKSFWMCACACGTSSLVSADRLLNGKTRSCGCLRQQNLRHGEAKTGSKTPEYAAWESLRHRCTNPRAKSWSDYGGRGISICKRWDSYEAFLLDMGRKPTPKHSIDRIDNNGNYEPTNCRWATSSEQQRNKRNSRRTKHQAHEELDA